MITFRRMIYILIAIIILLSAAIVALSIDFKRAKQSHQQKINELNYVIAELVISNDSQQGQLKISDDLREKLRTAKEKIDRDLLAMQYDFVEILSENKLL
jgi:uncharacterized coiled-coil protein SlyX